MATPRNEPQKTDLSQNIIRPQRIGKMQPTGQTRSHRVYPQFLRGRHLERHFDLIQGPQPYATIKDIESLVARLERTEIALEHGVQPVLKMMASKLEFHDPEPPAASAAYDWGIVKGRLGQLVEPDTNTWNDNVNQAIEITWNLLSVYDDLSSRLSHHVALIECVKRLVKLARSYDKKHLARAALTISDALHSVYAEDLTKDQVDCICDVTQQLRDDTKDITRTIDRKLRSQGFETIPSERFQNSVA